MSILVKPTEYLRIEDIRDLRIQFIRCCRIVRLRMARNRKQANKSEVLRIEECVISNARKWGVRKKRIQSYLFLVISKRHAIFLFIPKIDQLLKKK